jgi:hypothetical protein
MKKRAEDEMNMEKLAVCSWDKMQTIVFVIILAVYFGFYGTAFLIAGPPTIEYWNWNIQTGTIFLVVFVWIILWILYSYSFYSLTDTELKIARCALLKKTIIQTREIKSFETIETGVFGRTPIKFKIIIFLKNNQSEKLDFFSEKNRDRLVAALKSRTPPKQGKIALKPLLSIN